MNRATLKEIIDMLDVTAWDRDEVLAEMDRGNKIEYSIDTGCMIRLCFECEKETWVELPADHPMLTPYYDVVPHSIEPAGNCVLAVWINNKDYFPSWK